MRLSVVLLRMSAIRILRLALSGHMSKPERHGQMMIEVLDGHQNRGVAHRKRQAGGVHLSARLVEERAEIQRTRPD